MRQLPQQQQQQQVGGQPLRWLSSQPAAKEQAPWARPEENGNVMPSSLRQTASPSAPTQAQPTSTYYQTQMPSQMPSQMQMQGNGYGRASSPAPAVQQNFGSTAQQSGLRLQINNNNASQSGPKVSQLITGYLICTSINANLTICRSASYPLHWNKPQHMPQLSPTLVVSFKMFYSVFSLFFVCIFVSLIPCLALT